MGDPLDCIRRLGLAAKAMAASNDNDARDIGEQIERWIADGAIGSLDAALGLRVRGGISPQRAMANADRDRVLRQLVAGHHEWSGMDPMTAARRLRREFDRYETGRWLRERAAIEAPSAEPAASFWRILRGGARMPQPDRLRQILTREIR